ncbi:Yvgn And cofactor Nadph [Bacillus pseudomycoides]|nr:Yvgn And cofactor Nadph [Bacillus pseudomycoides]
MKWLAIGIGILILFVLLILLSKLSLKISLSYTETEKQCLIQVKIWMIHYTFDVLERIEKQQKKTDQKIEKAGEEGGAEDKFVAMLDSIAEIIKRMQEIHTMFKGFLQKVKIKNWRWRSQVGTGDAASTGVITGYVWSVKGMIVGMTGHYMDIIGAPQLEVAPIFQGKTVASHCELTASFRIYRALKTAIRIFVFLKQQGVISTNNAMQQ